MNVLTPLLTTTKISLPLNPQARSNHLQSLNMAQDPLQMSIRAPWLELRLHMTAEISLCPHQSSFIVLYTHCALRIFDATKPVCIKSRTILQVWQSNNDGRCWLGLEAQFSMPGHLEDVRISMNASLWMNCGYTF